MNMKKTTLLNLPTVWLALVQVMLPIGGHVNSQALRLMPFTPIH